LRLGLLALAASVAQRRRTPGLAEARAKPAPPLDRRRKRRLGLLALALVLTGCGSADKKSANTIASAQSPTELALAIVKAGETQAARTSTLAQSSPEGGGPTTVTVLQQGLADDSVEAVRHVLRFAPNGDGWRLVSSVRTERCRPGRGHREFTAADCV
jgi:hypothetical protein